MYAICQCRKVRIDFTNQYADMVRLYRMKLDEVFTIQRQQASVERSGQL